MASTQGCSWKMKNSAKPSPTLFVSCGSLAAKENKLPGPSVCWESGLPGTGWATLADPEGIEFSVLRSESERPDPYAHLLT